jgi:glycerophosphoryl diester phosphodiesterase
MHLHPDFLSRPIAHRTLHDLKQGRPENSVEGARAAIAAGYAIEIDVQLTADNRALVFHDYDLARLTPAKGMVRDKTAAELAAIPLTGGGTAAPPLTDFLDLVAGQVPLLIEIKDQDGKLGKNIGPLETAVCSALDGYNGPVAVMSFNPHSVAKCAELAPNVPRGLVTEPCTRLAWPKVARSDRDGLTRIADYHRVGACFISHKVADLASPHVARIRAEGGAILCWTVRSAKQEAKARQVADNITFENYLPLMPQS